MPTLNDILTANGDYTPVSGYPVDDKYEDDSPVINVYDRTIGEIVGDTSTSGENVSQYLTFRIPRHPDHYDLIENGTNIRILYRLEDDTGEDVVPVNVVANEDYIIFGWKIPLVVTVNPGVVTFIIHAYKSENNLITYHYKTLPKTYRILETMETDVVVPEIEMYNLAEAYARGTITDVFGHTRPVEDGEPGYHDNSKYYKELAGTSKIDAETAKNAAEAAQGAAETAQQAAENARDQAVAIVGGEYVSYGQTQSLNDTQKNKARENIGATGPNGYYPNMTVGLSENFVGTGEPTRRIFNYDTAGGSADISDGNAEIEKMYGGTVVWNQLADNDQPPTSRNGVTFEQHGDYFTMNGTATSTLTAAGWFNFTNEVSARLNRHKVLVDFQLIDGTVNDTTSVQFHVNGHSISRVTLGTLKVIQCDASTDHSTLIVSSETIFTNVKARLQVIDLTQMFGSTIADHIYSLEQSQAGAGVAWFKKLFPLDYYPYDEGTLLNVNPAGIKTVGFNAYDKATGKAELIGGNQYQITGTYTSLSYSTGEVLTPDSTGCFTPTKTGELTVTGGGANTCVHLTWSGYRNGDYQDYWTRTRDINIQPYFPDGLKRAGTVYDEISKDKAIKRIGVVDLGSLNWEYAGSASATCYSVDTMWFLKQNILCVPYVKSSELEKGIYTVDGVLRVIDSSYTDAATFKAAMSGVMLYYELAEPVETQIDPPLNLLYQVSDFGTEQFLGAGATEPKTLPIIADIVYGVNYRDTIKNLPKNYAKVRGYYPDLYTGLADNLIDRKGNGTPQEISYRTSCGDDSIADDGNGIIKSIFGNTVVWNQLICNEAIGSGGTLDIYGGVYTLTPNISSDFSQIRFYNATPFTRKSGHKYYVSLEAKSDAWASDGYIAFCTYDNLWLKDWVTSIDPNNHSWQKLKAIFTNTKDATGNGDFCFRKYYEETNSPVSVKNAVLFDLTQMFGAGNEPSTLDDPRIKWIKDYANEYPEYNIGELISYNGSGIKTVGFNQWDEEWDNINVGIHNGNTAPSTNTIGSKNFCPILPSTDYYATCGKTDGGSQNKYYLGLIFYDENKQYISSGYYNNLVFKTPEKARFFKITTNTGTVIYGNTYNHDICINLSWSGYRNGEYEPYWSRILNLPISTYFSDGMKSAGSVRDELTKDKAVKRIGVVDLGTLPWGYNSTYEYFRCEFNGALYPSNNSIIANIICNKYVASASDSIPSLSSGHIGLNASGILWVKDLDYTDATAFKAAMSGVMLYYELAEPIETTITPPLDLTYKVADFGTEESITEGKSTPLIGIIKYSDDFTRGLVNMPKNYDTTASLDALAASLSAMLTSALDGTVTITRGAYDPATKKYEWSCQFTKNQVN